jgi:hypothetical protein
LGEADSHTALPESPNAKTSVSTVIFTGMGGKLRTGREGMPVQRKKDSQGPYYQWGDSGKKYHYEAGNTASRERAKNKATKQGQAARASGYRG